jgi:hypothetical protein
LAAAFAQDGKQAVDTLKVILNSLLVLAQKGAHLQILFDGKFDKNLLVMISCLISYGAIPIWMIAKNMHKKAQTQAPGTPAIIKPMPASSPWIRTTPNIPLTTFRMVIVEISAKSLPRPPAKLTDRIQGNANSGSPNHWSTEGP